MVKRSKKAQPAADPKRSGGEPDPGVDGLEKGLRALYAKKYPQAEKHLAQAAAAAEQSDVASRARRYLAVARERLAKEVTPDPYLEAVYERNRGNLEVALEICGRGGRTGKDERFAHLAASIHAARGDTDKAAKLLETAIQLDPRNRILAYHDADFAALREHPEHAGLFASVD
jgi:tetratricopeptide (TPR) repeat protein